MEDGEARGGRHGFQNLTGLLHAIISVFAMHVGGRQSDSFKGFGSSSHALEVLKAVDYFMVQGCVLILECLYDWKQTRLVVIKVKALTGSLV